MCAFPCPAMNQLFYGDNLHVLRAQIATESVDLIYLDPPFNSKRDYNRLFESPKLVPATASDYSTCVGGQIPSRREHPSQKCNP